MRVLLFFLVVSLHAKTPQWMEEQIQSDLAPLIVDPEKVHEAQK